MNVPFFRSPWQTPSNADSLGATFAHILQSGQYILGRAVHEFERELSARLGAQPVAALNSGTDALVLALRLLELQPGDEVVLPSYTFFACFEAVVRAGAVPVLCDSQAHDFLCSEKEVVACMTARTRAVMAVPLFGDASAIPAIARSCRAMGVPLIEDAAQALGARVHTEERGWQQAGTLGDLGTLSFYPTKTLGAPGDAGALTSRHAHFIDRAMSLRNHGLHAGCHSDVGYNSRMDEFQAAALVQGLGQLDSWLDQRKSIASRYLEGLAGLDGISLPCHHEGHAWNYFVLRCTQRDRLRAALAQAGVQTRIYYSAPIHRQPAYLKRFPGVHLPHAQAHAQQALALPLFPGMAEAEVDHVMKAVALASGRT
ncbi:DegT/DnrJ/EryC1/StrS family aminotransferase [Acidovorax sp. A79]|uniref:DegT/DnrJ/EryC1/StrS family aminotransferase n=1 Tax=Acidovorax sp. A79 TaxID=3056107 RepID=UPI0034E8C79D